MRISANGNVDLQLDLLARHAIILLDGKKVKMCIEADDERGYVDCYAELPGSTPPRYTEMMIHRLWGNVQILDSRTLSPERKFELDIKD